MDSVEQRQPNATIVVDCKYSRPRRDTLLAHPINPPLASGHLVIDASRLPPSSEALLGGADPSGRRDRYPSQVSTIPDH